MREPEGKVRRFAAHRRRDDGSELNASSCRDRRSASAIKEDDKDGSARRGFLARLGIGCYNDEEPKPAKREIRRPDSEVEYDDEDNYDEERSKAPFIVRIFAWGALLIVFFVCGYLGANYFFTWMDKKGGPRIGDVVADSSVVPSAEIVSSVISNKSFTLYIPDNGSFTERTIEIPGGMWETEVTKVLNVYIDALKESGVLGANVNMIGLFRGGDWLYLDMTNGFNDALKKLGRDKSLFVITGLVRTVKENFPPVTKVKFYIGGQESRSKDPVDLSRAWELPS